ncbi:hypothetical protein NL676_011141 [Syzygium grande]|nr:hypothetical protein NL676_011141 [Syzygium grande]
MRKSPLISLFSGFGSRRDRGRLSGLAPWPPDRARRRPYHRPWVRPLGLPEPWGDLCAPRDSSALSVSRFELAHRAAPRGFLAASVVISPPSCARSSFKVIRR